MKIVLVTGGFDPIHSGHIAYFKEAKKLGDKLVVGVNSDDWLTRKKERPFMPFTERSNIIRELSCVDEVFGFNDKDNTAVGALWKMVQEYPDCKIIFANGGDRKKGTTPEVEYAKLLSKDVEFAFGVGGEDKKNSSSWILKNWEKPTTQRAWGKYTILDKNNNWQVKELAFGIGKSLSDQRHFIRSEHWHVVQGDIKMDLEYENGDRISRTYHTGDSIDIPSWTWHKATNVGIKEAKVIEVWMGARLSEDDIERRD